METEICKVEKQSGYAIMSLILDSILWDDNEKIKQTFTGLLEGGEKNIILDLSKTTYVSSVVIASFVYMFKRAKDAGGNLILSTINPRVQEVLSMTSLDKVFDIAGSTNEAVEKLTKK